MRVRRGVGRSSVRLRVGMTLRERRRGGGRVVGCPCLLMRFWCMVLGLPCPNPVPVAFRGVVVIGFLCDCTVSVGRSSSVLGLLCTVVAFRCTVVGFRFAEAGFWRNLVGLLKVFTGDASAPSAVEQAPPQGGRGRALRRRRGVAL